MTGKAGGQQAGRQGSHRVGEARGRFHRSCGLQKSLNSSPAGSDGVEFLSKSVRFMYPKALVICRKWVSGRGDQWLMAAVQMRDAKLG